MMGVQKRMYFRILIEKLINELGKDIQMIEDGRNNWSSDVNRGKSIILNDALEQLIGMKEDLAKDVQIFHGTVNNDELKSIEIKIKQYFKNEIKIMTEVENIKYAERQYKLVQDSDVFKEYQYITHNECQLTKEK